MQHPAHALRRPAWPVQERLFDEISAALDTTDSPGPSSAPRVRRKGHWQRVWESAKSTFRASPSGGGGGAASDAELQLSLAQLHAHIQDSMAAEVSPCGTCSPRGCARTLSMRAACASVVGWVQHATPRCSTRARGWCTTAAAACSCSSKRGWSPEALACLSAHAGMQTGEFWHQLEGLAMEHQTRLFGRINRVLLELSTFIEDAVGDMLSLRLEPSDLRLDPPTPDALHDSMAALINKGERGAAAPGRLARCLGLSSSCAGDLTC